MLNNELTASLEAQVDMALSEDIGSGDITAQLIPQAHIARAYILCRDQAIICGIPWVNRCFDQIDQSIKLNWLVEEGQSVTPNQRLCDIDGSARTILTVERTALNFLQSLSATATMTRHYVKRLGNHKTTILDTRKTLPGWRLAQKYATRIGGAKNHRMGLFDAYLIKENHISACGSIANAINHARQLNPDKAVEIEVESLAELQQAIDAAADTVLLDNFSIEQLAQAVSINGGQVALEASGGIDLDKIHDIAATGVDAISVGAITKHVHAIDLSLRFE